MFSVGSPTTRGLLGTRTRRHLVAIVSAVAIIGGGLAVANAAAASPTLTLTDLEDGVFVASAKGFAASSAIEFMAEVDGGSGEATATSSADGRAIVAFQTPDGFAGKVTVTVTAGTVKESDTITIGSAAPAPAKPATPAVDLKDEPVTTPPADTDDEEATPTTGAGTGTAGKAGFVKRDGINLTLDGKPWKFVGYNNVNSTGCEKASRKVDDYDKYYSTIGEGAVDRIYVMPGYDLNRVDRLIAAAEANNAKVYITLFNVNGYCGSPSWDSVKGGSYKAHVDAVVGRYKDSTTVAFWEIINEGPNDAAGYQTVGSYIKSIDPNHLVASGSIGSFANDDPAGYQAAHAVDAIDIISMHEYDTKVEGASHHIKNPLVVAKAINKPIIVGEFGMDASPDGSGQAQTAANNGCISYPERARLMKVKTDDYLSYPEVAGVSYWSIGSGTEGGCDSYIPYSDTGSINAVKALIKEYNTF